MGILAERTGVGHGSAVSDQIDQLRVRIGGRLKLGLHFQSTRVGLRRDLTRPFQRPAAKIAISVRSLTTDDLAPLFSEAGATNAGERLETARRMAFATRRPNGGYVAVDERNGAPCYVQWLFGAADNDFVLGMGGFPKLAPDEALLENAYTPPSHRGLGIMSEAMALIAERAADFGARTVITFVEEGNIASLKGCQRSGFYPDLMHRTTRWGFGLLRDDSFTTLAADDPRRAGVV